MKDYVLDINIDDRKPMRRKPYNLNKADREELDKILDKWLAEVVIRRSNSCWASPVFLVKGKEKSRRVIDCS